MTRTLSRRIAMSSAMAVVLVVSACARRGTATLDEHSDRTAPPRAALPAGAADAQTRLAASPRHAEWVTVSAGGADSVRAWVVYPQRQTRAPVVVVVHEIFGLTPWIRAVADQLAADGFIAIAPDLLTSKNIPGSPENPDAESARAAIRTLDMNDVHRQLHAVARYGMALPAARPRYGIVGFCWGGSVSFAHATRSPELGASVVYYGGSPAPEALRTASAPVLGLYGENDARVNSTITPADSALRASGKTYEHHIFAGAGHGFLRAQEGNEGQNMAASREAWPKTVAWFRKYLDS